MPITAFNPKITSAGLAAAVDAANNEIQLSITHMQLGTGRYTPTSGQTALVAPVQTVVVSGGGPAPAQRLIVMGSFQAAPGAPYFAGEIGFWAGDPGAGGVLVAVHSHPVNYIGYISDVAASVMQYTLGVEEFPADSVTVTVDPDESALNYIMGVHLAHADPHPQYPLVAEAQAMADSAVAAHEADANPHPQYTGMTPGMQIGYVFTAHVPGATYNSVTDVIPEDDTIPQSNEGKEYAELATAYTPQFADSYLEVEVFIPMMTIGTNNIFIGAIFRDDGVNAIGAAKHYLNSMDPSAARSSGAFVLQAVVIAGSAPTTFKFRFGGANNTGINLDGSFGAARKAYMRIREIKQ